MECLKAASQASRYFLSSSSSFFFSRSSPFSSSFSNCFFFACISFSNLWSSPLLSMVMTLL